MDTAIAIALTFLMAFLVWRFYRYGMTVDQQEEEHGHDTGEDE